MMIFKSQIVGIKIRKTDEKRRKNREELGDDRVRTKGRARRE